MRFDRADRDKLIIRYGAVILAVEQKVEHFVFTRGDIVLVAECREADLRNLFGRGTKRCGRSRKKKAETVK